MTLFDFGLDIVTEDEKALASKQASKQASYGYWNCFQDLNVCQMLSGREDANVLR
jgi:hypothetical protein